MDATQSSVFWVKKREDLFTLNKFGIRAVYKIRPFLKSRILIVYQYKKRSHIAD